MSSEENIDYHLTENFFFFLDILKQPEEVFDCRSREYKLAKAWLDKLSMGTFETTEELRQRNIYMSHLVACLNYGKLTGPFISSPKPDPFHDSVDFQAKVQARRICPRPSPGMTASEKACLNAQRPTPCECDYVCCDKDDDYREQKKDCTGSPFDRICGYMTQYVNVPACLDPMLDANLHSALHEHRSQYHNKDTVNNNKNNNTEPSTSSNYYVRGNNTYEKSIDAGGANICLGSRKSDEDHSSRTLCKEDVVDNGQRVAYRHITALLKAIASELRGDQSPGSNDFLEYELARYKNFIKNYSNLAGKMLKLQKQPTLRSFLLLNLQNDLVKLLNESSQPEVNMEQELGF